jgi:hypothetical protein
MDGGEGGDGIEAYVVLQQGVAGQERALFSAWRNRDASSGVESIMKAIGPSRADVF